MDLDGALTDTQVGGHDLVGFAAGHHVEHLALAWRERFESLADHGPLLEHGAVGAVLLQRALNTVDQVLVAEGLLQEVERTGLHGLHRHRHIAVAGNENDRDHRAQPVELLLQLQAAHFRHAHVQHQAARLSGVVVLQEFAGRSQCRGHQPDGLQQQAQRAPDSLVIVNDEDHRRSLFHIGSSLILGRRTMKHAPTGAFGR